MSTKEPKYVEKVFARDVKVGDWLVHNEVLQMFSKINSIDIINGFAFDIFVLRHSEYWPNWRSSALEQLERLTPDGIVYYKVA